MNYSVDDHEGHGLAITYLPTDMPHANVFPHVEKIERFTITTATEVTHGVKLIPHYEWIPGRRGRFKGSFTPMTYQFDNHTDASLFDLACRTRLGFNPPERI